MYKPVTIAQAVAEFLDHQKVQVLLGNHSESTLIAYRQDLQHITSVLGNVPLAEVSQRTIDVYCGLIGEYVSLRTGRHLSPHTINKRLRTLRRLFNFCKKRDYMTNPPVVGLVKAEVDLEAKTIPLEDVQKILQYAGKKRLNRQRDTFIVIALIDFGPRSAEVATLRMSNVDRANRTVTIRRKGGRIQTVPVSKAFIKALTDWLRVRPVCKHDYVLCSSTDKAHPPLTSTALGQAFRRMAIKATDKSWGPHAVRHCWISEQLNNTSTPPKVVQDIAGHRTFRTTEQYAKPDIDAQRGAVEIDLLGRLRNTVEDRNQRNSGVTGSFSLN